MGEKNPKFEQPTTPEEELKLVLDRSEYLLKHIQEQNEQIDIDDLTKLKSRKVFKHELEQSLKMVRGELRPRSGAESYKEASLIYIDIDYFKQVNDTFGHSAGDEVLKKISELLRESVREADIAARFGGEELIVLLRGADEKFAAQKAEELRAKVEQLTFPAHPELKVTASFGVVSSNSSTKAEELYNYVDKALYVAKRGGRNRVEIYI